MFLHDVQSFNSMKGRWSIPKGRPNTSLSLPFPTVFRGVYSVHLNISSQNTVFSHSCSAWTDISALSHHPFSGLCPVRIKNLTRKFMSRLFNFSVTQSLSHNSDRPLSTQCRCLMRTCSHTESVMKSSSQLKQALSH